MKTRKVYLKKDEAFTAAQTLTFPINVVDPISSIDIFIEMTNGATMTKDSVVKINAEFTGIVLKDGADILVSASMRELQSLNVAELGHAPLMLPTLASGGVQQETCHIHFGLSRNDPVHYLRPPDFNNLQMEITNTFTTAGATSWAVTGHTITVIANVIDEGAGDYQGFLSPRSVYPFTCVSGAIEEIDIDRDFPIRLMQISSFITGKRPDESISAIELNCDAGKHVPVDIDYDHLMFENFSQFAPITAEYHKMSVSGAELLNTDIYYPLWGTVGGSITGYVDHLISLAAEQLLAESYGQDDGA